VSICHRPINNNKHRKTESRASHLLLHYYPLFLPILLTPGHHRVARSAIKKSVTFKIGMPIEMIAILVSNVQLVATESTAMNAATKKKVTFVLALAVESSFALLAAPVSSTTMEKVATSTVNRRVVPIHLSGKS